MLKVPGKSSEEQKHVGRLKLQPAPKKQDGMKHFWVAEVTARLLYADQERKSQQRMEMSRTEFSHA